MPDRLVGDSEFSKVHSNHLRPHLNSAKHLSVVNSDNGSNHLRYNNHITKMGLNTTGLFTRSSLLLSLSETLDESQRLTLESTGHTTTSTGADKVHEFLIGEVKELIELNSAKGELAEGTLPTQFLYLFGVHVFVLIETCKGKIEMISLLKCMLQKGSVFALLDDVVASQT